MTYFTNSHYFFFQIVNYYYNKVLENLLFIFCNFGDYRRWVIMVYKIQEMRWRLFERGAYCGTGA